MRRIMFVFLLLAASASAAFGQQLRPISAYMGSQDMGDIRYVARRCAALYILIGPKAAERGAHDVAAFMEKSAGLFLLIASNAAVTMGTPPANASSVTREAVRKVVEVLGERMNRNMAITGSFYVGDALLESDLTECGATAESLLSRAKGGG
jgi:hypothetical protein